MELREKFVTKLLLLEMFRIYLYHPVHQKVEAIYIFLTHIYIYLCLTYNYIWLIFSEKHK